MLYTLLETVGLLGLLASAVAHCKVAVGGAPRRLAIAVKPRLS